MRYIESCLRPNVNSSLDSYLANSQMARNKVRVKGIEILSPASLLSTDVFVYTQFVGTYKWQIENRHPRKLSEFFILIGTPHPKFEFVLV